MGVETTLRNRAAHRRKIAGVERNRVTFKKFPVPLRREFCRKHLNLLEYQARKSKQRPSNR